MNSKHIQKYKLFNGKYLYFSAECNKFWIDTIAQMPTCEYYDKTLVSLRLELTGYCNGKCKYCIVYGNNVEKIEILDIASSWKWITSLPWFKYIKDIFILGGEPMLQFNDILFILEHFNGTVGFSTNATLITYEKAKLLAAHNAMVYVSLDGMNAKDNVNRIYKDGTYMYDDIINGLDLLEDAGVKKGIFMVATQHTIHNIPEILEELSNKYKLLRIGYSLPHWTKMNIDTITAEQYRDALLDLFTYRKNIKSEIMQLSWRLNPLMEGKVKEFSCPLHTQQITMLPDKSFVRCSKIDSLPEKHKYTNAWLDENCPISICRRAVEPCASCIAVACCGGGCPFDGIKRYGMAIDRRECIITPPLISVAIQEILSTIEKRHPNIQSGEVSPLLIKEILSGK